MILGEALESLPPPRYALAMEHVVIPPNISQFHVLVQDISPLSWRQILIRSDMSLATLHATRQIVFAWSHVPLRGFHRESPHPGHRRGIGA